MGREMISAQQLYAVAAGQPDVTTHDPQGQIVPAAQSKVEELREYLSSWNQNAPGYRALERTTDPSIPSKYPMRCYETEWWMKNAQYS